MKVAIYIRVGNKEQLEADKEIEVQRNELRDFCEKKNYKIVSEYAERRSGLTESQIIEELKRCIREKEIQGVVITDYSKISRNINELMNFCNFMKENGGTLVSTNHTEKQEKEIDFVSLRKA
ncbi:recombinase family protein [Agathobacter rectalis]|nr:recombinase family protein [Agathobacter rectalis]